jgi:transposase
LRAPPFLRATHICACATPSVSIFTDAQFAPLFARRGQPAACPWRLALVTLLQYAENLSDRRAAEATRGRIDWKYLLGLELGDPGFDASILSEFRTRLVVGGAEEQLLDTLLDLCRKHKLLTARGRQRTDATHVLGAVRALNRLECAAETLRAALNALATAAPDWLHIHADPAWIDHYARRADEHHIPQAEAARRAYAEQVGRDGHRLLAAIAEPDAPAWLREVPAVERLRRVWVQTFYAASAAPPAGKGGGSPGGDELPVRWRTSADGFPTSLLMVASPYDPDVHYARKRTTAWIGYKVHMTETCDEDRPHLITHVETAPAPIIDREALDPVHASLAAKDLLPSVHLVDGGYVDADQLVASTRDYGVTLVGPTPKDRQWQARAGEGFTLRDFHLDWDREVATCPAGHASSSWTPDRNQGRAVVKIRFSTADCRPCLLRSRCTRSARRLLTPRCREEYEALEAARTREADAAFAQEYRRRAGIEGTLSEGVRALHLRRARYIGLAKTHLQHVLTAAAINLARLGAWLGGEPTARTRQSAFARLMAAPVGG